MESTISMPLICEPNNVVGPVHPKAMPVLLTSTDEMDIRLEAPWEIARELQRPLPEDQMLVVSRGNRKDPMP
jgi:putative SOS response-associated peptidase YedK